jgi:hypothetical protein
MKKAFILISFFLGSHLLHASDTTPGDTTKYEAIGSVKKRFGVFLIMDLENLEDVDYFPSAKANVNLEYYLDKKGGGKGKNGKWVIACKAVVYRVYDKDKTIEFKLLEDPADRLGKEGIEGGLKTGDRIKFNYEVIGY